jgi:transposase-like protein
MSERQPRRHFGAAQKAEIVRRHLNGKEPVSNLADEFHVQPTQIHTWIKQVLDQAEAAFERPANHRAAKRTEDVKDQKIAQLEAKLTKKDEVIVELMQEHVQLKKELGEL